MRRLGVVQLDGPRLRAAVCLAVLLRGIVQRLAQCFDLVLLLQQLPLQDLAALGQVFRALGVALVLGLQLAHFRRQDAVAVVQLTQGGFVFALTVYLDAGADFSNSHQAPPPMRNS